MLLLILKVNIHRCIFLNRAATAAEPVLSFPPSPSVTELPCACIAQGHHLVHVMLPGCLCFGRHLCLCVMGYNAEFEFHYVLNYQHDGTTCLSHFSSSFHLTC